MLRTTLRAVLRSPWFMATAIATVALGVGANLTVFSLVSRVLLAPLPYRDADRLVWVGTWHAEQGRYSKTSGFDFDAWRQRPALFESVDLWWDRPFNITGTDRPEGIVGQQFTPGLFAALGTPAALGRTLVDGDGGPGRDNVVVLSDRFWRRRFDGNAGVIGTTLELDGRPFTIAGVMPPSFLHPNTLTDVWVPASLSRAMLDDRKQRAFRVVARLRDGVTPARAEAELRTLAGQHAQSFPDTHQGFTVSVRPLREFYVGGGVSRLLWIVQGTAAILLLIASANVASLVLVRASRRQRETAVRLALGASRGHLLRQHLLEGVLLAGAGGALGVLLAAWGAQALPGLLASAGGVTWNNVDASWFDRRVLLFAIAATTGAGITFGVTPLLRGTGAVAASLRSGSRGATADRRTRLLRQAIVTGQIALSVLLLVGAGLLVRSFVRLHDRSFGFEPDGIVTAQIGLPRDRFASPQQTAALLDRLVAEVGRLPGVQSAAAINTLPLTGFNAMRPYFLPGRQPAQDRFAEFRIVTADYFRTMRIPLRGGRFFDERDRAGSEDVVIVNETTARRMWPGADPVGQTLMVPDFAAPAPRIVVGVVEDTRHHDLAKEPEPEVYRPAAQAYWPFFGLVIRTGTTAEAMERSVLDAAARVDRGVPVTAIRSLSSLAEGTLAWRRSSMALLTLFAVASSLLAFVGVYSVMAYSVQARAREIGVRLALGATPSAVARAIVKQGVGLTATGLAIGLVTAAMAGGVLRSLLFGVTPIDPVTFAAVSAIVGVAGLMATALPALTATRVDPTDALRSEE
jgi:putative ABC transport system permease protein